MGLLVKSASIQQLLEKWWCGFSMLFLSCSCSGGTTVRNKRLYPICGFSVSEVRRYLPPLSVKCSWNFTKEQDWEIDQIYFKMIFSCLAMFVELLTWRSKTLVVLWVVCPLWMEQLILVAMTGVQHNFFMRNCCTVKSNPMEMCSVVAEQQLSPVSPHWEMTNI